MNLFSCSFPYSLIFYFYFIPIFDSIIIHTTLGSVDGKQIGNFHLFKKIPFAKPPIGELRFQRPESIDPWNNVLDATEYGPACMSNYSGTKTRQKWVDEDCLHINIFTSEKCLKSKDCAVVNYLHGGALHYDSAVMFNDTHILNTFVSQDVVFVIPAFRLGIFSHFVVYDQSIAPNNLALFDILFGLEFVKSDIHNFGGNNKKVTLLGHSYGGTVASMLSFSTKVNTDLSLFQQYIAMSSPSNFDTLETQIERTIRFAEHADCISKEHLNRREKELYMRDCLLKKDAMELLRIERSLDDAKYPTYGETVQREPLFQEVEEKYFMDSPQNVTALTGCIRYEVLVFDNYDDIGISLGFENPKEVDEKYRNDKKKGDLGFNNKTRDETQEMIVQARVRVDKLLEKGVPAYLYEYTYPKHANHTDDLFYIMGVHPFEQDENEKHLGDVYRNMFLNFIKTGKPGLGFEMSNREKSSYFEVFWNETTGERPKMRDDFEKNIVDYWTKRMVEFDKMISLTKNDKKKLSIRSFQGSFGWTSFPFSYVFIIIIPFIAGVLITKYCCLGDERRLYIQLDGNDYPIKT